MTTDNKPAASHPAALRHPITHNALSDGRKNDAAHYGIRTTVNHESWITDGQIIRTLTRRNSYR